jgi:imidazolonepropionase-like amidohydrolase
VAILLAHSRLSSHAGISSDTTLVIENCSLFDPHTQTMMPDRTIVVRGERIAAVQAAEMPVESSPATARIDGRDKFVLPGLIDAHMHLVHVLDLADVPGEEVLPLYLAAGVTSVRSTGDEFVAATKVKEHAEANPAAGPRVFLCSPLLDADPPIHGPKTGLAITNPADVPPLLDDLRRRNVTTLKIYAGTRRDVGRTIIEEGHRRGFFVTAHLGAYSAQDAVADGIDGLEHIWSVFNYVVPAGSTRSNVDFDNPQCAALIAQLVERKTYVDPTLTVFRNMILLPDLPEVSGHADNALAPAKLREFWPRYLQQAGCPQGGDLDTRRREFAKYQELTGRLYRAGVPLLVGTDSPEPHVTPGFSLHQELELLVESGLSPAAVLRAATLHNATALQQHKHLGSVEAGKLADMLVLSANPLTDIRRSRSIDCVIRGGILLQPADLLAGRLPK